MSEFQLLKNIANTLLHHWEEALEETQRNRVMFFSALKTFFPVCEAHSGETPHAIQAWDFRNRLPEIKCIHCVLELLPQLNEMTNLRKQKAELECLLQGADFTCAQIADLVNAKPSHRDLLEAVQMYVESHAAGPSTKSLVVSLDERDRKIALLQGALQRADRIAREMISGKVQVSPAKAACQMYGCMILEAIKTEGK